MSIKNSKKKRVILTDTVTGDEQQITKEKAKLALRNKRQGC